MTKEEKTLICQQNENGKYGFVNEQGKEIIPFIFERASEFRDGYALVIDNEKQYRKFINTTGKIVLSLECDGATQPQRGKVAFCKDKKFGLIDITNGNMLLPLEYDEISVIEDTDLGCFLRKKRKVGFADINGKIFLPCIYDEITPFNLCAGGKPFFRLRLKEKIGLADFNGTMLVDCNVDDVRVKMGRGKNKGKYRIEMFLGGFWYGVHSSEMDFETY
jgi:hypothetical protein